jgi:hypothetical protein
MRTVADPSRFKDTDYQSVLPEEREVMSEENRIEGLCQEVYRSLGKIFQCLVRYTVWTRSLSELEIPDGS